VPDADKVIVSCALTGAVTTKKHCPAIPYTPVDDNFYLPSGEMAESNGELVAAAAELVKLSGRSVATVDETKQLLWPSKVSN